jgi:hypothetical protein
MSEAIYNIDTINVNNIFSVKIIMTVKQDIDNYCSILISISSEDISDEYEELIEKIYFHNEKRQFNISLLEEVYLDIKKYLKPEFYWNVYVETKLSQLIVNSR